MFFKCNKSHLKLNKEFQCRSYDSMIGHTTIVFTRYIFLAWENRKTNDPKTLGMIFYDYCSEVKDVDLETALKGLLTMVQEIIDLGEREITINTEVVKKQLDNSKLGRKFHLPIGPFRLDDKIWCTLLLTHHLIVFRPY